MKKAFDIVIDLVVFTAVWAFFQWAMIAGGFYAN